MGCHPGDVMTFAAYGLARQAASPRAARRLRKLLRKSAHSLNYNVVSLLACVNDSATRVREAAYLLLVGEATRLGQRW
jgi:hypothetical protein